MVLFCVAGSHSLAGSESDNAVIHSLYLGILDHDSGVFSTYSKESGTDINLELVFNRTIANVRGSTLRPNLGVTLNNTGDTSKLYGGLEWNVPFGRTNKWFLNWRSGLAIHDGEHDTDDNNKQRHGSSWGFCNAFELGYAFSQHHSISIMIDHLSNGGLRNPNDGLDTAGIRYRLTP